jgi:hypothetical protein
MLPYLTEKEPICKKNCRAIPCGCSSLAKHHEPKKKILVTGADGFIGSHLTKTFPGALPQAILMPPRWG